MSDPNALPNFDLCPACEDGSCPECGGGGETAGWYFSGDGMMTCETCNGTGVCYECGGVVISANPHTGASLLILPNDLETWADVLAPTPKR